MPITSEPLEHVTDFVDSVLRWTPEILLAENAYDGDVLSLPHLPQTQSVSEYKTAYRPAVRAEVYAGSSQALQRPDKLVRPIHWTEVVDLSENHKKATLGSRSALLELSFNKSSGLRPKDFVFISPSPRPWQETAIFCASGLVHSAINSEPLKCYTACVEVSRNHVETLTKLFGPARKLYTVVISSIASGYRILDALCDSGHSDLLMEHVLHPGPVLNPSATQIQPHDAAIVETLSVRNKPLNQSQKLAIIAALQPLYKPVCHPILLLGPPGTGKTHTLSSLILAIILAKPEQTIHVAAPSNAAVREIAFRLLRDAKRTNILHTSQMCLFGNEESVDTADGIEAIYFVARSHRLRNFHIRLHQAKTNLAGFHAFVKRDDQDRPSIPLTWEWRKDTIDEGRVLMAAFITDLTDSYVDCRSQAEQCLDLLAQWAEGFQPSNDSLDDAQNHLIVTALPLLQQCKSSTWDSVIQDAVRRECYEDASDARNSWQVTVKQISAAQVNETIAQIRAEAPGQKLRLADGMASLAEVELMAESVWKIVFTKTCKQQIQSLNSGTLAYLIKSFEVFANGYPARAARSGFTVRGMKNFVKCLPIRDRSLLWSVRVLATPRSLSTSKMEYEYGQAIWLWAYPLKPALQATVQCIENACANLTEEYLDLCTAEEWTDGRVTPLRFTRNMPIIERMQMRRGPAMTPSTDTNELDLAKAYEINPRVCKALTQGFLANVELPFVLSAEETALVHDMDSTFVIGRSGTGKTTVMVLRMFAKAESAEDTRCSQMLLTASPKLCLAIKEHFTKLRQNWSNGSSERGRLLTASFDEEDTFLDIDDPPALQSLKDSDFPLFWTFGYLLRVLDRSVPGTRFWGFRKLASELRYPSEVDWERFQTHYLHRMPPQARKTFVGGSKLFAEIQTVIKGSLVRATPYS